MAESIVTVKLDPEQMQQIKDEFWGTIEKTIQERQAIKEKTGITLKYITEAFGIFSKLHPESVIGDAPSFFPDLQSEVGIISGNLLEAIQLVKQVYDSIETEVSDEPT